MKDRVLVVLLASVSALHAEPMTIDLPSALTLADERNSELAVHLKSVELAALEASAAWYPWIPTLRGGVGYVRQDGALQDTSGTITDVERTSHYAGFGAGAVGSGVPARPGLSIGIDFADAVYAPLAARQRHTAARLEGEAVRLRVMFDVAAAYYGLVRSVHDAEITRISAEKAEQLGRLTANFAESGEGLPADAERAAAEALIQRQREEAAKQHVDTASINLVRLLRLEGDVLLRPADTTIVPLALVDPGVPLEDLLSRAVENRPELGQARAVVESEKARLKQQTHGWFMPKVEVGYSYGSFGGGSGTQDGSDDERSDLYGMVYWQLDSLGLRNRNRIREQSARMEIARAREQQALTDVLADVRRAYAEFHSARRQLALARQAVDRARKSYELNSERIFENQGLPLEAMQSMKALAEAESLYLDVAARHNLLQFCLISSTGQIVKPAGE